jgi:hypothetical protein
MTRYYSSEMNSILGKRIQAKKVMFFFRTNSKLVDSHLVLYMKYQSKFSYLGQRIYAGPFNWQNGMTSPFPDSPLFEFVDRESEYYVFENLMGKTIREEEFNEQYDREARLLAFPRVRIL